MNKCYEPAVQKDMLPTTRSNHRVSANKKNPNFVVFQVLFMNKNEMIELLSSELKNFIEEGKNMKQGKR